MIPPSSSVPSKTIPQDTKVFLSPDNSTVLPVVQFTCDIQNEPACRAPGGNCISGIECCSGRCSGTVCRSINVRKGGKDGVKLGRGTGRGGAAGRDPTNRRMLVLEKTNSVKGVRGARASSSD